jgi:hypothetical protein
MDSAMADVLADELTAVYKAAASHDCVFLVLACMMRIGVPGAVPALCSEFQAAYDAMSLLRFALLVLAVRPERHSADLLLHLCQGLAMVDCSKVPLYVENLCWRMKDCVQNCAASMDAKMASIVLQSVWGAWCACAGVDTVEIAASFAIQTLMAAKVAWTVPLQAGVVALASVTARKRPGLMHIALHGVRLCADRCGGALQRHHMVALDFALEVMCTSVNRAFVGAASTCMAAILYHVTMKDTVPSLSRVLQCLANIVLNPGLFKVSDCLDVVLAVGDKCGPFFVGNDYGPGLCAVLLGLGARGDGEKHTARVCACALIANLPESTLAAVAKGMVKSRSWASLWEALPVLPCPSARSLVCLAWARLLTVSHFHEVCPPGVASSVRAALLDMDASKAGDVFCIQDAGHEANPLLDVTYPGFFEVCLFSLLHACRHCIYHTSNGYVFVCASADGSFGVEVERVLPEATEAFLRRVTAQEASCWRSVWKSRLAVCICLSCTCRAASGADSFHAHLAL